MIARQYDLPSDILLKCRNYQQPSQFSEVLSNPRIGGRGANSSVEHQLLPTSGLEFHRLRHWMQITKS